MHGQSAACAYAHTAVSPSCSQFPPPTHAHLIHTACIESGMRVGDHGNLQGTTYESNVLYTLRFMIDLDVVS